MNDERCCGNDFANEWSERERVRERIDEGEKE